VPVSLAKRDASMEVTPSWHFNCKVDLQS